MAKEADARGVRAVCGEYGGDGRLHLRRPAFVVVRVVVQRADVGAGVFVRIKRGANHRFAFGKRPRVARTARRVCRADEQDESSGAGEGAAHHAQMGVVEGLEAADEY